MLSAFSVLQAQTVSVDKTTLSFSGQAGGPAVSSTLAVTGTGSAQFFVSANASWLKVNNASSAGPLTVPATLTVTADPAGLTAQTYTAQVLILPVGANTVVVNVTFNVGAVGVSPASVSFAYQAGAAIPAAVPLALTSTTSTAYSAQASTTNGGSWLQISGTSGTSPGTLSVSLNAGVLAALAAGTYNGSVVITPSGNPAITIPVTLTVTAAPTVTSNTSTINLNYQIGGATGATNSASTVVTLSNPGTQDLPFAVATTPNGTWLSATSSGPVIPAGGTATVTVSYLTAQNLAANNYTGQVTVFIPSAQNQTITIPVNLRVSSSPLVNVPGATLSFTYQVGGAIPTPQNVVITSSQVAADSGTGQMTLLLTKSDNSNWLSIPSVALTGTASPISVAVNPTGLAVGNYTATISVLGSGAANNPQTIPVTLRVSNDPLIVASFGGCSTATNSSCPLNFMVQSGQTATTTQTVHVQSSTGGSASFTAAVATTSCGNGWLSAGVTAAVVGTQADFPISVAPGSITVPSTCDGTVTITGTNPTTGAALPNSPVTIPVKLYLSANAMVVANPVALSFNVGVNATSTAKTVAITSTSSANIDYNATSTAPWLLVFPQAGSTNGSNQISVIALSGTLTPGTYNTNITVTATTAGVQDSPLNIPVTLTVSAATMTVTPTTLSFQQALGTNPPAAKTITVSTSSTDIPFTAAVAYQNGQVGGWLSATPSSGTATSATPATVSIAVNGTNLPAGTYNGTVTIAGANANGSPATVNVTLEVQAGTISASPTSLSFTQVQNGTAPDAKTIAVTGTPGALAYTVAVSTDNNSGNWLAATPTSGTTTSNVSVSVNSGSLAPGQYTGKVKITSAGASGSPITVPVTLTVAAAASFQASPTSLNFSYIIGTTAPQTQTVALTTGAGVPFTAAATTSGGGNWLTVAPTSGTGSATLTIGINTQAITGAGDFTGTVTVTSPNAATNPAATITVKLSVTAIPKPVITAVANAASYVQGAVSPGENIVIFGTGIGPATITSAAISNNAFPTTVGNTQVFFDNIAAPILYVSGTQTSVMVPYGIAGRASTNMRIVYSGVTSDTVPYNVVTTAPGVYTANAAGNGQGAILNQDYSVNASAKPAAKNSVVTVYMTGEGVTSPSSPDGRVAPADGTGLYKPVVPVTATVGGQTATVEYYGTAPGIIYGVMQVNVRIPANAASGNLPIVITVGGNPTSSSVTVAVQ
jgi:uncharacterized protein (TIGR03437 family)